MRVKQDGCMANSVYPDQTLRSATSDLSVNCLVMPVFPNT